MTSRNRVVLIIVLILLAIANGYLLVIPLSQSLKEVNTQVAAVSADVELAQQKITDLKEFDALLKKYPTEADLLTLAAPGDLDLPQFMVQIEAIAVKSSVSLTSIEPPTKGEKDVTIQVSGSFETLAVFIVNLEKNLRPSKVSELQIAAASETNLTSMTVQLTPLTLTEQKTETEAGATGTQTEGETTTGEQTTTGQTSDQTSAQTSGGTGNVQQ